MGLGGSRYLVEVLQTVFLRLMPRSSTWKGRKLACVQSVDALNWSPSQLCNCKSSLGLWVFFLIHFTKSNNIIETFGKLFVCYLRDPIRPHLPILEERRCVCVWEREREREILLGGGVSQRTLLYVEMKQFALLLYMMVGEGKLMKGILIVIALASSSWHGSFF